MKRLPKRTISISVKLSPEDWAQLQAAADRIWPDAPITRAGIVSGLAKLAAKDLLAKEPSPRKTAKKS